VCCKGAADGVGAAVGPRGRRRRLARRADSDADIHHVTAVGDSAGSDARLGPTGEGKVFS